MTEKQNMVDNNNNKKENDNNNDKERKENALCTDTYLDITKRNRCT